MHITQQFTGAPGGIQSRFGLCFADAIHEFVKHAVGFVLPIGVFEPATFCLLALGEQHDLIREILGEVFVHVEVVVERGAAEQLQNLFRAQRTRRILLAAIAVGVVDGLMRFVAVVRVVTVAHTRFTSISSAP